LNASANGPGGGAHGRIDGTPPGGVPPLHDDARETAQNDLDHAFVIDAAARAVDVGETHADSFDGRGELPESPSQLACDAVSIPGA
jgi:hypothetical protein